MIGVQQTRNIEIIEGILHHPDVWRTITDDYCGEPGDRAIPIGDGIIWLLMLDDDFPFGVFMFHAHSMTEWEVHTNVLPSHRGKSSARAVKAAWEWMKQKTEIELLITKVPAGNYPAKVLAQIVGMTELGRLPRSVRRNGELIDQTLMGVNR